MAAYLRVAVGAEHHALAVDGVREVVPVQDVVPVPGAGPHVLGVQALRGELLPVVGLAGLIGTRDGGGSRVVVVQDGDRRAGFLVDRAEEVEELDTQTGEHGPGVMHEGRLIGVLDIPALLDTVVAGIA